MQRAFADLEVLLIVCSLIIIMSELLRPVFLGGGGGWVTQVPVSLFRGDVRTFRDVEDSALRLKSLKFSNVMSLQALALEP